MTSPNEFFRKRDKLIVPGAPEQMDLQQLKIGNNGEKIIVHQGDRPQMVMSPEEAINFGALMMKHASAVLTTKMKLIQGGVDPNIQLKNPNAEPGEEPEKN